MHRFNVTCILITSFSCIMLGGAAARANKEAMIGWGICALSWMVLSFINTSHRD